MWVLITILTTIISAVTAEANRHFQCAPIRLNFYRTILAALLTLACSLFFSWPTDFLFYAIGILTGLGSALSAVSMFYLSAKYNGRVGLLSGPLVMFILFFIWLYFDPKEMSAFIDNPLRSFSIIILFSVATGCIIPMCKNTHSTHILKIIVPLALINVLTIVIARLHMEESTDLLGSVSVFSFLIMGTQVLFSAGVLLYKKEPLFQRSDLPSFLWPSIIMGVSGALACYGSWIAIILAPNPAYPSALFMLATPMLMVYHKMTNVPDDANPVAGLILVLTAIVFVVITA